MYVFNRSVDVVAPTNEIQVAVGGSRASNLQEVQETGQFLIRGLISCMADDRKTIEILQVQLNEARDQISMLTDNERLKEEQNRANEKITKANAEMIARVEELFADMTNRGRVIDERMEDFSSEIRKFCTHTEVLSVVDREVDKIIGEVVPKMVNDARDSDSYTREALVEVTDDIVSGVAKIQKIKVRFLHHALKRHFIFWYILLDNYVLA
jgi:hypothetical protein